MVEENVYTHCFVSPGVTTITSDLRGNVAPEIYGWTPIFAKFGLPWIIENPSASEPDVFAMPEFIKLFELVLRGFLQKSQSLPGRSTLDGRDRDPWKVRSADACPKLFFQGREKIVPKVANIGQLQLREHFAKNFPVYLPNRHGPTSHKLRRHRLRSVQPNAKELRAQEDKMALAGVRTAAEAITRLPGHIELGKILATFFINSLRQNPRLRTLLITLGSGSVDPDVLPKVSEELDQLIIPARENLAKIWSCADTGPVKNDQCSTDIRANLLHRWADAARDPGAAVCEWYDSQVRTPA